MLTNKIAEKSRSMVVQVVCLNFYTRRSAKGIDPVQFVLVHVNFSKTVSSRLRCFEINSFPYCTEKLYIW